MKEIVRYSIIIVFFSFGCTTPLTEIEKKGKHYQEYNDFESLNQVVELIELNVDTSYVKSILGEPIDMGVDYRYLIDSLGLNGCSVGAVFHIDENGKIDSKWLDEICE